MKDIKAIVLKLASPEEILSWSHGEVTKPETINYRTQRPERDGLFSEQIFGPVKDYECACGKYKKIRYKGIVCDRCGVEVTSSAVRRERMGHIKLATPVAHLWYLRTIPSRIALFLGISQNSLEKVIYYTAYIITKVNEKQKEITKDQIEKDYKEALKSKTKDKTEIEKSYKNALAEISLIKKKNVISEIQYLLLSKKYGHIFEAEIGGEPIKRMLEDIDLKELKKKLEDELAKTKSEAERGKILKRLRLVKHFLKKNLRPEWMFLTILPVLPPDLRPMVALDGGRYATSDLNDLYRRVINRNNRLKKLQELRAPEVIIRNERRMLQEAVDALIDNTAHSGKQPMSSSQKRPLRSLSDILKGKKGRFRQNLLGKRVDYSGRSVIVVGPELKIDECGLPRKMALELFKPFVIHELIEKDIVHNIKTANLLIQQEPPEVWAALEEVIKGKYVLLNRAPTLHRLGIQAFRPKLVEGLAIQLPPLVCGGFNADFDGDQMAVHLPLSEEAQQEAKERMAANRNLLKPAAGESIAHLTQDIVLGIYYLTKEIPFQENKELKIFSDEKETLLALENKKIALQEIIKVRPEKSNKIIETTAGRLIFNSIMPVDFEFVNKVLRKKDIKNIAFRLINDYGMEIAGNILDEIKKLAFEYATISGISWGMDDLQIPAKKKEIIDHAEKRTIEVKKEYEEGLLSESERKAKISEFWTKARERIRALIPETLDPDGSVYTIIDSGSRGSWDQPLQMSGIKGLVQNPKGEIIELPIKSSYKEGFNPLEYFISTHGSRKGSTDTALKTSHSGYLTRRLVDVSQEIIVREDDCGTKEGITIYRKDGLKYGHQFKDRIFGRTALKDIKDAKGNIIVKKDEIINRKLAEKIDAEQSIESIEVRSPITCKSSHGVCAKCYGLDLATNKPVEKGTAVGVIAAQSIGEPGTQLTMRTFHIGGIAGADITHGLPRVEELFEVRPPKFSAVISEVVGKVKEITKTDKENIITIEYIPNGSKSKKAELATYKFPKTLQPIVKKGELVSIGQALSEGHINLRELLKTSGKAQTWRYIINEIQKVYVTQGALISNKHIEIIIRQMFSKVKIKDPGESEEFVEGDIVDKSKLEEENNFLKSQGKKPAKAQELMLGITKSALYSDSFLSAASFQETTRALVSAACEAKEDPLIGLKENVIIGRLVPAGTGFERKNLENTENVLEENTETIVDLEEAKDDSEKDN